MGARVTLVSTVDLPPPAGAETSGPWRPPPRCRRLSRSWPSTAEVVVMAAAVADFRPKVAEPGKIKKDGGVPTSSSNRRPTSWLALGAAKRPGQILVGFAAETSDLVANAESKLRRKNLDLIVANDVGAPQVGFPARHQRRHAAASRRRIALVVALTDKRSVARAILQCVVDLRSRVNS